MQRDLLQHVKRPTKACKETYLRQEDNTPEAVAPSFGAYLSRFKYEAQALEEAVGKHLTLRH